MTTPIDVTSQTTHQLRCAYHNITTELESRVATLCSLTNDEAGKNGGKFFVDGADIVAVLAKGLVYNTQANTSFLVSVDDHKCVKNYYRERLSRLRILWGTMFPSMLYSVHLEEHDQKWARCILRVWLP